MRFLVNDRWQGSFIAGETGSYVFTITAWVDRFKSWCQDLKKRVLAGQKDLALHLLIGAQLISEVSQRASRTDSQTLNTWLDTLKSDAVSQKKKVKLALSDEVGQLMEKYADRQYAVTYPRELDGPG